MGTASSVLGRSTVNETEDRTPFGDRVEITKSTPVENFGEDDSQKNASACTNSILSTTSLNDNRIRETTSVQRIGGRDIKRGASIRSVVSLLRGDAFERTRSECTAEAEEGAAVKLQCVLQEKRTVEAENVRLKSEASSLRANVTKWRNAHDMARKDEKQALLRAENLEKELDRVKRQFKFYRSGKENEIHDLVKTKHELENALRQQSGGNVAGKHDIYPLPERLIAPFDSIENLSLFKVPGSLEDARVSDRNTMFPLMAEVMTSLKLLSSKRTFTIFLSADKEARRDAKYLKKAFLPKLEQLCERNRKFLRLVESFNVEKQKSGPHSWELEELERCDLFFGLLGNAENGDFLEDWKKPFHIFGEKNRPLIFCIKDAKNKLGGGTELTHFIDFVAKYDKAKVSFYSQATNVIEQYDDEVQSMVKEHFGIIDDDELKDRLSFSDEELISDCESSFQQFEMLRLSAMSTGSDVRFTKYYDQLNEYISGSGPCPPLLVSGASGAGKTSLLANWIRTQLSAVENVVLYHFVGSSTSDSSTDPGRVVRRFTSQLLGLVPGLCSMVRCDPVKCEEYFPRLLEIVPPKVNTTIVIVIDSVDKLQNAETSTHLAWLNDPLPATVRVILSVTEGNQSTAWSSWPAVNISPLSYEESSEVLVSSLCNHQITQENDEAHKLLQNLSETAIASPLFLTMLSFELSRSPSLSTSIAEYSSFQNVVELTVSVLGWLEEHKGNLINQVLTYICCSRRGLAESELMELLSLQRCEWVPLLNSLTFERPILIERNGLLVVSHEQILKATLIHLNEKDIFKKIKCNLAEFYLNKLRSNYITHAIVDQLPWLLVELDDKEKLQAFLSRTDVFQTFIRRSLYSELVGYWKYINVDFTTIGNIYFEAIKKKEGDTPSMEIALLYETLGRFLKGLEVLTLAMKCLERSLEIKEMVVDSDDLSVGQSLHYLADLYVLLGNLESAESSYKQTLQISENALGKDHPLVAKELESLAYVKKKQNNNKVCSEWRKKAAQIRQNSVLAKMTTWAWPKRLDPNTIKVDSLGTGRMTLESATSLNNLGVLFMVQKNYEHAEKLLKKSLDMRESLLGGSDPAVCQSLESLASLYYNKKMYPEAICRYEKSLDIKRKNLDPDDPNLISTMNRLAMTFQVDGKLERSESVYRQVLAALKRKHRENDPVIATALHNLAVVNSEQKKLEEALALFNEALKIYEESLGNFHPKVAESLRNLAKVYLDMGNSEEASSHLRRSQLVQENDLTSTTISSQPSFAAVSCMDDSTIDWTAQ